ncbi:hypothetical protein BAE44_0018736 [Dichanthelium oligosanthes]|uniref:Cytochrome P450 89A2 n=1 Tax=Dichanthelium oligosanthes TaxID=888268 RepID=A0A1E5V5I1_9POAL|nr:hypothetical protein BAE44_0018736 [Dichanthelium oligosanthes]
MDREVGADAAVVFGATAPDNDTPVLFTLLPGEIARDRKLWTYPDEFRPERFLAGGEVEGVGPLPGPKEIRMMPFGSGRRHCPGAGLGMMHVRCFLAAVVRDFEWAPAAEDDIIDLTELDEFFKVMKTPLRAYVTPRM